MPVATDRFYAQNCGKNCGLDGDRIRLLRVTRPITARPHASEALGDTANVVEKARPALPARERAIERSHGTRAAFVLIVDPGAQNGGIERGKALCAQHTARSSGIDAGSGEHPLLRPYRKCV